MIRSMTLIPVSSTRWSGLVFQSGRAARWIGMRSSVWRSGRPSSTGLPSTSMMRPRWPADRHRIGAPVLFEPRRRPSVEAHRDGANDAVTQLLLHFQRQADRFDLQCIVNFGIAARELDVHDGADNFQRYYPCSLAFPLRCWGSITFVKV